MRSGLLPLGLLLLGLLPVTPARADDTAAPQVPAQQPAQQGDPREPSAEGPRTSTPPGQRASAPLDMSARFAHEDIRGLACDADDCFVQLGATVHRLDPTTLALGAAVDAPPGRLLDADGPAVLAPCETAAACLFPLDGHPARPLEPSPRALPREPAALSELWNRRHREGWRVPFLARAPSPTGGMLFLLREGAGRLMRTGGGVKVAELDVPSPLYRYEPAVAVHPTGAEAFVLAWPGGTLTSVVTARMEPRWALDLGPAAHGLFVDPGGRLLVAEEAGAGDGSTSVPDGLTRVAVPADLDPTGDLALFLGRAQRPDATRTVVVDLAVPRLVWREAGRYLSLVSRGGGSYLLATERAVVRLAPDAEASAP